MIKVGDCIRIVAMEGEPHYTGKEGEVKYCVTSPPYFNTETEKMEE